VITIDSILTPPWPPAGNLNVHASTRFGGVSKPPYDSLNLGFHVGDDDADVISNRQRLAEQLDLPGEPVWLNQVHGSRVVRISRTLGVGDTVHTPAEVSATHNSTHTPAESSHTQNPVHTPAESPITADGAWTNTPGIVLTVLTADCLPVVIADKAGTAVAVVHAGWRGLANGVLQAALAHFPADASLHAWLGPAIGPQVFEVGEDVRQAFMAVDPANDSAFTPQAKKGKYLADIYALARRDLNRRRTVSVTGGEYCTVSDPARFHSHRRDGVRSGRMATLAWLDPAT
jgi:YfiH family protein